MSLVICFVSAGLALTTGALLLLQAHAEKAKHRARLAEKARLGHEVRRAEQQLHQLSCQAFEAMLWEVRQAVVDSQPPRRP